MSQPEPKTTAVPGPWIAEHRVCKDPTGEGLAVIAVIPEHERDGHMGTPTRGIVAWVHSGMGACHTDDQAIATARLISAAPDLLEALRVALPLIDTKWWPDREMNAIRQGLAAIRKAEGEKDAG